jgi:allantoinase
VPDADLVVRGGRVVRAGAEPEVLDVAITDGRVAAVGAGLDLDGAWEIDASGLHVLPGGVDPHVHFNEPGRAEWEGFASGSRALATGGFTTFVDMPLNSLPVTVDADAFDRKVTDATGTAHVDFGLWGGLLPGRLGSIEELVQRGAMGFKAFLCASGIPEFPAADDLTLYEGMRRCAALGAIVLVHAESQAIVAELARQTRDFGASRPVVAELEAITRALFFAGETGCAVHVVHVSTARGVRLVERARAEGVDASCETCPHHLLLSEEDLEALGAVAKCAPPLRAPAERDELWSLLEQGRPGIVASDHSPCPPELKRGDLLEAWGGISGCQTTRQLLLAAGLPPPAVAAVTATNPARRFRLPAKGAVEVGRDADLALVDLAQGWTLTADELRYRHRQSPYVGRPVRGRVVRTLLRGRTVFEEGRIVAGPFGRLVKPAE